MSNLCSLRKHLVASAHVRIQTPTHESKYRIIQTKCSRNNQNMPDLVTSTPNIKCSRTIPR
jgi:hypothetical protein